MKKCERHIKYKVIDFALINKSVMAYKHRQFGQRQFSKFEIQTTQPEIYRQFSLRQFSKLYKMLDMKEKQDCSYQGKALNVPTAF